LTLTGKIDSILQGMCSSTITN